ncbi:MAG: hypothetical protein M1834_001328 [Cirrosporium novae-zelandiae]|nr:MAG: hypothetical protein M1834_001328 [Cirrosporium novae-zelandiae]
MRNKASSSMQKTYDECYLICSTAIYFEGKNNETEALRSWKSALDQIYYHNAYRIPANYQPKNETEKALQDALRDMERQCKERVDLLEALKQSRIESKKDDEESKDGKKKVPGTYQSTDEDVPGFIGGGTIPAINYPDISKPTPQLPARPNTLRKRSSDSPGARPIMTSCENGSQSSVPKSSSTFARTLRTPSPDKKSGRMRMTLREQPKDRHKSRRKSSKAIKPAAASKAAGLAWDALSRTPSAGLPSSTSTPRSSTDGPRGDGSYSLRPSEDDVPQTTSRRRTVNTSDELDDSAWRDIGTAPSSCTPEEFYYRNLPTTVEQLNLGEHAQSPRSEVPPTLSSQSSALSVPAASLVYRREYPEASNSSRRRMKADLARPESTGHINRSYPADILSHTQSAPDTPNHASTNASSSRVNRKRVPNRRPTSSSGSQEEQNDSSDSSKRRAQKYKDEMKAVLKRLPKGVDQEAAKQIINEIVVKGDEVHWDDVAGLDIAKTALKEAVVYPFLRPDLFMGLREPARGMLLFGPPGTGKTMLARAVATESKSTFFAISASSLTSKWLGESEKLVRALFALAKALAPSIIFVDEIDSLLSARSNSNEHETSRRIKTEFLIQWSDLQRAAAGRDLSASDKKEGDASRVLVLAATNMPWAIDEAARRRFVRRQYIPLPEGKVRGEQLRKLLASQKHCLGDQDIEVLIRLTEDYSGSDITALAKDAAMGPLRSLGEALLSMSPDQIRPISFNDFETSIMAIRPSVSKDGLKQYEDWAKEFGERGG